MYMNIQECDILNALMQKPFVNQRILAEETGYSLGLVNRCLKNLVKEGYLSQQTTATEKALALAQRTAPKNAVILAAGFGMRMVPINTVTSKGLLEVQGEPLVERIIRQLHQAGITDISIVVGFLKEQYEYLMDTYGVKLVVNPEYASKNNLHSLKLVLPRLSNTYIIPCDLWCRENPFRRQELCSWYMVSDRFDRESTVRVNRKLELAVTDSGGNAMIGISYLLEDQAALLRNRISQLCRDPRFDSAFWEEVLYEGGKMCLPARVVSEDAVVEINTFEQLRELDSGSNQLKSDALTAISRALQVPQNQITDITVLKKGMTNRSFLFCCNGKKYIMRIPGEGTDRLINRREEFAVYQTIKDRNICDDITFIDPDSGYKITEFLEGARVCDPLNRNDLQKAMAKLKQFHGLKLKVSHEFDIFGQIAFYESLWNGKPSIYRDYVRTKEQVLRLKAYIDAHAEEKVLTHIDAVPDNFLFVGEDIRLIDWEYAGMQDPHVDIAMFCIYALYDREQIDTLIDIYFDNACPEETRIKIYCYVASCGLLWSNWCEYKRSLGVEFGEYSLRQYRYAKEYCRIVQAELEKRNLL